MYELLLFCFPDRIEGMKVQGLPLSPIQHLVLASAGDRLTDMKLLQDIVEQVGVIGLHNHLRMFYE